MDKQYKNMLKCILETGTNTVGHAVRPHWEDGQPAHTKKIFGYINRFDLRAEFPILTIREVPVYRCLDEILWIYQKKSNNIRDLHSHIWDSWADEGGSIGKAYGYQIRQEFPFLAETYLTIPENIENVCKNYDVETSIAFLRQLDEYEKIKRIRPELPPRGVRLWKGADQMDAVLYDLKHNPFSRSIIINMYNHHDLYAMNLRPCAYSVTFNVTDEGFDKPILNMLLNMRSCDTVVAGGWNVAQYAFFQMMVAQVSDMIPGQFIQVIADAHIYDRHILIADELLEREEYPAPKVTLDPDIKDFYQFTTDSITVTDYKYGERIKIPVAI